MQRYFSNQKEGNQLYLDNNDLYHIKTVMRLKDNDLIEIVYDKKLYICEIINDNFNIKEEVFDTQNNLNVTLIVPILKEQKMDYILQKATELGVSKIIPIITERSVIKINDLKKENKKIERWRKIVKEASEQSKRLTIPIVENISEIKNLQLEGYKYLCSTNEKNETIKNILSRINIYDKIVIAIGPEGGFSDNEEKIFIDQEFKRISLGDNILRVETAPLFLLSVLLYVSMR